MEQRAAALLATHVLAMSASELACPALATGAALLVYYYQGFRVGFARMKYGIKAPATTGHPIFERTFRVHYNTLENLVIFLPSYYVNPRYAGILGAVFCFARLVYGECYIKNPESREFGALLTAIVNSSLLLGGLYGAVRQALKH